MNNSIRMIVLLTSGIMLLTSFASGAEIHKLSENSPMFQRFGRSVALSASTQPGGDSFAVVGAPGEGYGIEKGTAFICAPPFNDWTLTQCEAFSASDGFAGDEFGFAVAISDDDIFVVGNTLNNLYIYPDRSIAIENEIRINRYGIRNAVAAAGRTVLVSAGPTVYWFTDTSALGDWSSFDEHSEDLPGHADSWAVATDGRVHAVGAPTNDGKGAVFLYESNSGRLLATPTAESTTDSDQFGSSVAIQGRALVVGAPAKDQATGAAYLFLDTSADADWSSYRAIPLTPPKTTGQDRYGISVALMGRIIAVGATRFDCSVLDVGKDVGTVWLYKDTSVNGDWSSFCGKQALPSVEPQGARLGISVALSDTLLLAGAYHASAPSYQSGAVYLFDAMNGYRWWSGKPSHPDAPMQELVPR